MQCIISNSEFTSIFGMVMVAQNILYRPLLNKSWYPMTNENLIFYIYWGLIIKISFSSKKTTFAEINLLTNDHKQISFYNKCNWCSHSKYTINLFIYLCIKMNSQSDFLIPHSNHRISKNCTISTSKKFSFDKL